jgi:hypothetical protein
LTFSVHGDNTMLIDLRSSSPLVTVIADTFFGDQTGARGFVFFVIPAASVPDGSVPVMPVRPRRAEGPSTPRLSLPLNRE